MWSWPYISLSFNYCEKDVFLSPRNSLPEMSHCDTAWTEVDEARNTWVTIFGFPPSAASFILSQFSHYGSILEKRVPTKGNWIHIRYQTKLECRKALSNNGKVFGGTIMIGVMLCKDQVISFKLVICKCMKLVLHSFWNWCLFCIWEMAYLVVYILFVWNLFIFTLIPVTVKVKFRFYINLT